MNKQEEIDSLKMERKEEKVRELKTYSRPELMKLGAMQKYTLGGSVGFGDSGGDVNNEEPF